jgi:molybdate transport system substrate-binding protein
MRRHLAAAAAGLALALAACAALAEARVTRVVIDGTAPLPGSPPGVAYEHAAGRAFVPQPEAKRIVAAAQASDVPPSRDLKVLTAGALEPLVAAVAAQIGRDTGRRIVVETGTAGALGKRAAAGEAFDAIVVTQAGIDQLMKSGKVAPGSAIPLARVGIGVAVKAGTPPPDIHDIAALRRTLLDARAVALIDPAAGGSSGIYLAGLFERMGIAGAMQRKAVLVPGGLTGAKLVSGEADLALQQITELHAVPGTTVVGPLPAEVQNYTVYTGAVSAGSGDAGAATALLERVRDARARMGGKGLDAP